MPDAYFALLAAPPTADAVIAWLSDHPVRDTAPMLQTVLRGLPRVELRRLMQRAPAVPDGLLQGSSYS